ncbi:uncharacterized protein [Henckelia pumila]|uniref:uncharacterized protein isoform X1 n=1 Tax=Henckelia pumila TaxID=405737 RepID=UPI003C6E78EE
MRWSSFLRIGKEVLIAAKPIVISLKHLDDQPVTRVQISTMTVKDNLMVIGGFQGDLIYKNQNADEAILKHLDLLRFKLQWWGSMLGWQIHIYLLLRFWKLSP